MNSYWGENSRVNRPLFTHRKLPTFQIYYNVISIIITIIIIIIISIIIIIIVIIIVIIIIHF